MNKQFKASVGLISILLLISLLAILFISKDNLIHIKKITQRDYHQYLKIKLNMINELHKNKEIRCKLAKKDEINISISGYIFTFFCKKNTIFKTEPTKKKYVFFKDIQQHLDIVRFQKKIVHIRSLADLPKTSRTAPVVVIADFPIDERLKHNFYGIIITKHYFDITGKKFYGKLYSSYQNQREERNLSYNKTVIDYLYKQYVHWSYLPHSQHHLYKDQ